MIRVLLLCTSLLLYPYIVGSMAGFFYQKLWKRKLKISAFLMGLLSFFGLFELLMLVGNYKNVSASTIQVWGLLLAAAGLLAALACLFHRDYRQYMREKAELLIAGFCKENLWYVLAFAFLTCVYFLQSFSNETRFHTPETVMTILQTDSFHTVNPLTGLLYTVPLTGAEKLVNLPAFYAMLVRWFGLDVTTLLFQVIPVFTVFAVFLVMKAVAELFFEEKPGQQRVFLLAFVLVTLCGNHAYMNTSYGILHVPYEGSTLFESILLPLAFVFLMTCSRRLAVEKNTGHKDKRTASKIGYMFILWLLFFLNAAFLNGLYKGCLILAAQVVLYGLALLFYQAILNWKKHIQLLRGKGE